MAALGINGDVAGKAKLLPRRGLAENRIGTTRLGGTGMVKRAARGIRARPTDEGPLTSSDLTSAD